MNQINKIIKLFTDRYEELAIDPTAKFLRPTLKEIILKLEDNDIIGAYNVANSSLEKADSRDNIKINMFIEVMDLEFNK
jgi:hypothetical protein